MKHLFLWILLPALLVSFAGCGKNPSFTEHVMEISGVDLTGSTMVSSQDTHGGFHGDGATVKQFDCSQISDSVLQQTERWNCLPLSENLQLMMYGGTKNGTYYGHELAERYGIPEVQNGCYFFLDRQAESADSAHSDANLLARPSFNFTLLILDTDNNQVYFFKFDT